MYLAEDEVLPRVVALKLLPAERNGDEVLQRRFMREARAASALSHPNIARIYEAGEDGGRVFIAMEYVDGETLETRIRRGLPPLDEIVRIALQLVDAVREAHACGVIHRDLKPSNVMLTSRGEVKVLDFGLAKFDDPQAIDLRWKTETGLVMGTVPYMSPEQALGNPADHRADIFSIGVVLYQLVTARLPFAGATTADTLFRIVNTQPEPMARFNYDLPLELERIIRKCLEKSPDRRYQNVAELLVDLRNFDRDRGLGTHPHAIAARVGGASSRTRTAIWVTMLLAAAMVAVALWKQATQPPIAVRSIAVMPFENHAGASDSDLGEGIPDLVISDLARLPGVRVMARSTSFRYRAEAPAAAGKALRVDAVLTGNVEAVGDRLAVSTELVDVRDGARIGGARFERTRGDLATLAGAIGEDIARSLSVAYPRAAAPKVDAEAYRLYLAGRKEWNTRSPEGFRAAIVLFQRAIAIEPRFAPAYAGLADTYTLLERYDRPSADRRVRAIAAADRAVELDPALPEAHASLASVRETYSWDWAGAEREYRTAIRLSPSYATAHHWLALLLTRMGRFDEALEEIALARELDPLSPSFLLAASYIHYHHRDFARSVQEARAALRLQPDYVLARVQLALSLAMSGDAPSALAELHPVRDARPEAAATDALIRARLGDTHAARPFLRAAESGADAAASGYAIAAVRLAIGDRAETMAWLRKAAGAHNIFVGYVAVDPLFTALHGDPDFNKLLQEIGLVNHDR